MLWKTVKKSTLVEQRNGYEDEFLKHLRDSLPEGVVATVVADRGFGDQKRYQKLVELGMHYVIRFRENILVAEQWGKQQPAAACLPKSGRATMLKEMAVTANFYVSCRPWCWCMTRR